MTRNSADLNHSDDSNLNMGNWVGGLVVRAIFLLVVVVVLAPLFVQSVDAFPALNERLGQAEIITIAVLFGLVLAVIRGVIITRFQ